MFRNSCGFKNEMIFTEIHRTNHLNIGSSLLLVCYWHLHHPSTSPQRDPDFSSTQGIVLTRHMPCQSLYFEVAFQELRRCQLDLSPAFHSLALPQNFYVFVM